MDAEIDVLYHTSFVASSCVSFIGSNRFERLSLAMTDFDSCQENRRFASDQTIRCIWTGHFNPRLTRQSTIVEFTIVHAIFFFFPTIRNFSKRQEASDEQPIPPEDVG